MIKKLFKTEKEYNMMPTMTPTAEKFDYNSPAKQALS